MKTSIGLVLTCSLFSVAASAGMLPSRIILKFNQRIPGYTFFWKTKYENKTVVITGDTTLIIPASDGLPDAGYLQVMNNGTGNYTDTLAFLNCDSPDRIVTINGIAADTVNFVQEELPFPNGYLATGNPNESDEELSTESIVKKKSNLLLLILLSAAVAAVTSGLTWLGKRQANKNRANRTGT